MIKKVLLLPVDALSWLLDKLAVWVSKRWTL